MPTVGEKIRALRESYRDSQAAFARRLGTSQMSISRWEDGEHVSKRFQKRIAALADKTVAEFFHAEDVASALRSTESDILSLLEKVRERIKDITSEH